MNAKAIGFVVRGMLATETESAVNRISRIMSANDEYVNLLCDGIVTDATIEDANKVFDYVRQRHPNMCLMEPFTVSVERSFLDTTVIVSCTRIVWKKEEGGWQSRDKQEGDFKIKAEESYKEVINLYPDSKIPGVKIQVI